MKQFFLLLLPLLVLGVPLGEPMPGSGTVSDPYQITTVEQLQDMRDNPADHYILMNDIDASATSTWNVADHDGDSTTADAPQGFEPIGTGSIPFSGSFNGKGHSISGLVINRPKLYNTLTGLFGVVNSGMIDSVHLTDITVHGYQTVGGIAGEIDGKSTLSHSSVSGYISGNTAVGGVVGYCKDTSTISLSRFDGEVHSITNGGGIVGSNYSTVQQVSSSGTLFGSKDCGGVAGYNYGTLINTSSGMNIFGRENVGGIVGENYHTASVANSLATGFISGSIYAAGVVGENGAYSTITNCYWDSTTSHISAGIGRITNQQSVAAKTSEELKKQATYANWDFSSIWNITEGNYPYLRGIGETSYTVTYSTDGNGTISLASETVTVGGDGSAVSALPDAGYTFLIWADSIKENPRTIHNVLADGSYKALFFPMAGGMGTEEDPYLIKTAQQLQSMKHSLSSHYRLISNIDASETRNWNNGEGFEPIGNWDHKFTGSLNGAGYEISNLYINRPDSNYVALISTTSGDVIVDSLGLIDVTITGKGRVAGIVASTAGGAIRNSHVTGVIEGKQEVGGIAGFQYYSTVENCYTAGIVRGKSSTGGVVGDNYWSTVTRSSSTADIFSQLGPVGGIAGENSQSIAAITNNDSAIVSRCYYSGTVKGTGAAGGLVGYNYRGATIENCYSRGVVQGNLRVGGLVGSSYESAKIVSCYTTSTVYGIEYFGGLVGSNKKSSTITNSYWDTTATGCSSAIGEDDNSQTVSAHTSAELKQAGTYASWDFSSIWDITADNYPFLRENTGVTFTLTYSGNQNGTVSLATQTIAKGDDGAAVTATPNNGYVFARWSDGVTANPRTDYNVIADGEYEALFFEMGGGLGTVDNPYLIKTVEQLQNIDLRRDLHYRLANDIDASATANWNDGKGFLPIAEKYSDFSGSLKGNGFVIRDLTINRPESDHAALFGQAFYALIDSIGLVNISVTGRDYVGGIAGEPSFSSVQNCFVSGVITGDSAVGGIVGYEYNGSVTNSYSNCTITGETRVGGIAGLGRSTSIINNCYSLGTVRDRDGTVSYSTSYTPMTHCFLDSSFSDTGAYYTKDTIASRTAEELKMKSTYSNAGWSFNSIWAIDEEDDFPKLRWSVSRLSYPATVGGVVSDTVQYLFHGSDGESVTATPLTGYSFVQWSDGVKENSRTDKNITRDTTFTAEFTPNIYRITYRSDGNGSLSGDTVQDIPFATLSSTVTAVADTGYHFMNWSDGRVSSFRRDTVKAGDTIFTAYFAIDTFTVQYKSSTGGTINADAVQRVTYKGSTLPVEAVANPGYIFSQWSDGSTANPRTDLLVKQDTVITAEFAPLTYTITYSSSGKGSLFGDSIQILDCGQAGTQVIAVPEDTYHFTGWSDGNTSAARTDIMGTHDTSFVATFARDTLTLTYLASAHGVIAGDTIQTLLVNTNGSEVIAVADAGYRFVSWSDGVTTARRQDKLVTTDITVTALFSSDTVSLTYHAQTGGVIAGDTIQTLLAESDGSPVTAIADVGYTFIGWSDGSTVNPRTDLNVTESIAVTAQFNLKGSTVTTYSLNYGTDGNGSITGVKTQTIVSGSNGSAVKAVANTGYRFVQWSDGSTANPRTDLAVTADISVIAIFDLDSYKVIYETDGHGTISGTVIQTVSYGMNGTEVTAVPADGYDFLQWSDGSTVNPRTDLNITGDTLITAQFDMTTALITTEEVPTNARVIISPNPIPESVSEIAIAVPSQRAAHISVSLFDCVGNRVAAEEFVPSLNGLYRWNIRRTARLAPGTYLAVISVIDLDGRVTVAKQVIGISQ